MEGISGAMTCGDVKEMFEKVDCCGSPAKSTNMITYPKPPTMLSGTNVCEGKKVSLDNTDCVVNEVVVVLEQAGANITKGYVGGLDTGDRVPITTSYLGLSAPQGPQVLTMCCCQCFAPLPGMPAVPGCHHCVSEMLAGDTWSTHVAPCVPKMLTRARLSAPRGSNVLTMCPLLLFR